MNALKVNRLVYVYILLFPALVNVFGEAKTGQRLLHVVTLPLLVFLVLLRRNTLGARGPLVAMLGFTSVVVSYYLAVAIFKTQGLDLASVVDVGRPLIYLTYLLFPFFFRLTREEFPSFVKMLTVGAVVQVVFSSLVYFPAFSPIQDLFKGRLSNDVVLFHHFRWSGTLAWPSDFSFFLSLFIYFSYLQMLSTRRHGEKLRYAALGLFLLVGVLFTTSRGGLATIFVMVVIATLIWGKVRHAIMMGAAAALMLLGLFTMAELGDESDTLQVGYVTKLLDAGEEVDASTGHRIHELSFATEVAMENFPFGLGPDRSEIDQNVRVVESLYGHHLIKWGVVGLLLYLFATGYTFLQMWRGARGAESSLGRNFCLAVLLWGVSVPLVFGWSSAVTDRFKCLPFYYFIVGHVWATWAYPQLRRFSREQPQLAEAPPSGEGLAAATPLPS